MDYPAMDMDAELRKLELRIQELQMQNTALEQQVQSAERRLSEFKDAVMIVVRELARE
jgi:aminoglycoside N3'-acetyltransferase